MSAEVSDCFLPETPAKIGVLMFMPKPQSAISHWDGIVEAAPEGSIEIVPLRFADDPRRGDKRWPILEGYATYEDVADELSGLILTGLNGERRANGSLQPFDEIDISNNLHQVVKETLHNGNLRFLLASCWSGHFVLNEIVGYDMRILDSSKRIDIVEHEIPNPDNWSVRDLRGPLIAPHARWASVPTISLASGELAEQGLEVAAYHPVAGWLAATMPMPGGGQLLLCQGHPEYPKDAAYKEFRRGLMDREPLHDVDPAVLRTDYSQTSQDFFRTVGGLVLPQHALL